MKHLTFLFLIGFFGITFSQSYKANFQATFGAGRLHVLPQKENPFGFNLSFAYRIAPIPIYAGIDIGGLRSYRKRKTFYFPDSIASDSAQFYTKVQQASFPVHLKLGFDATEYLDLPLSPYFYGFFGARSFNTTLILEDAITDEKNRETLISSSALSYGYEVGFNIHFGTKKGGIAVKYTQLWTYPATYIKRESIQFRNEKNITYDSFKNRSMLYYFSIGFYLPLVPRE